jgi:WD40 repeat protein
LQGDGLPGVESQTNASGTRFITEPSGSTVTPSLQTDFYGNSRAEVLWVDRNHQFAIASHTAISGDGAWIQAGWYLNNERTSLYETMGTGSPNWSYLMPTAEFVISTDISLTGDNIGVIAQGTPCYSFASDSGTPNWTYSLPPGFAFASSEHGPTICVSEDGTLYAALAQQATDARIFVLNNSGDTIRTISFNPNTGIYGLDMTPDGSVFCVSTYYAIYIFNADGTRRDSISQYGQTVAKISGDGKYLVKGDFNTRAYLYRWNGSNYDLAWQCYTGHPWVTRVAISRDGSTIMAGTYQYSPVNSGKVLLFDSSSATPLWEYAQYGDYIASCALSENGGVAVAGSWGQYGGTYGDVLTVFERGSATPIFQLLDDIDEPGSIFSVDISGDGGLVSAGGKAVHAREFGNGGEVYSISTVVGIDEYGHEHIAQFEMTTLTPNPFVRNLMVHFSAPRKAQVSLNVYDITGRLVATILETKVDPGDHEVTWRGTDETGRNLGSGIYFLRADYESTTITRKVIHIAD